MKRVFILIFLLLFVSCERQSGNYLLLCHEPIEDVTVMDDHSEALIHWLKKGMRDEIVVNIDEHDDLRFISEDKIGRINEFLRKEDWDGLSKNRDIGVPSLFTLADFIYAGFRSGVIKRLYWISPSGLLKSSQLDKTGREFLNAFGYKKEDIKDFKADDGRVSVYIFNQLVVISAPERMPFVKKPVLLTIDLDYVTNAISKTGSDELRILSSLFKTLRERNLRVKDVTLAYSINQGYTEPVYRYIGDEIVEILRHPDILNSGEWPELWMIRASAFRLLREDRYEDALKGFEDGLVKFPDELSLMEGKAVALAMLGHHEKATSLLNLINERHPSSRYLYIHIAQQLIRQEKTESALRFMNYFMSRYPHSYHGLLSYGNMLYDLARDKEALKIYNRILEMYQDVNAVMYAGDALFHLRRFDEAREYYIKGLKLLNMVGYRSLRNFPESVRNMNYLGIFPHLRSAEKLGRGN